MQIFNQFKQGQSYFGTGCHTTPEFNAFCRKATNYLKKELGRLDGFKTAKFSKGHFYFSGMFQVNEKWFYISCSDVRFFPGDKILVRTAKHDKDYTGGPNCYVAFSNKIADDIARTFKLKCNPPVAATTKKTPSMAKVLAGEHTFKSSCKAANHICFDLIRHFKEEKAHISTFYMGRKLIRAEYQGTKFLYLYHAATKTATFAFSK